MTRVLDYGNEANYDPAKSGAVWSVYRRLVGYALRYKGQLVVVLVLSLVVAASFSSMILGVGAAINLLYASDGTAAASIASYTETIRDSTTNDSGETYFWAPEGLDSSFQSFVGHMREDKTYGITVLCIGLVILSAIAGLARYFQEYFAGAIGAAISVELNREMFDNIVQQSHTFFEKHTSGEVLARFTNDAFMVNKGLANVFVKLLREPIKAVFFLAIALSVSPLLTGILLIVIPPIAIVIQKVGKLVKKSARRSLQKVAAMASIIQETVSGIAVVKSFRMEAYERGRVAKELENLRRYLVRMARADAAIGPITEFIMVLGLVALIILSHRAITSGTLTPGDLTKLFAALAFTLDPLRKLATVNNMVQTSVASAERVFEFIDIRSNVVEKPGAIDIPPLREALKFENVRFAYNGSAGVLDGLNLTICKGEMVALVGFSGAGKSTIAKLIPRFYDPTGGRIAIDGHDIRDATFQSLRDQISIVTQDTILFHESIRGNIAFGQERFTDERVQAAARAAYADEFIQRLPMKYDEPLGESGGNLSGGQRQRLAIARAIIKDPAILILDEATSSLDSESEQAIQKAMDEFVVGRTTVVIAHRLSTVRRADRIVVLEGGKVAEEGTHAELLAKNGLYRRLYDIQFAPNKTEDISNAK